jgi:hypothetical protein
MKLTAANIVMIVLAIFVIYVLVNGKSMYGPMKMSYFQLEGAPLDFDASSSTKMTTGSTGEISRASTSGGVAASLQPNEIPVTEDFAQFNTDYILSSQNYLDPRNQIGYPETVGGTLRNSNLQIRSEPPNPRDPVSIFNLSTITPEQMRPAFEIGN